ncbi:MAG: hypothetical protein NXI32_15355 [bacterium]|nr:hypothetical protein [bacterium]
MNQAWKHLQVQVVALKLQHAYRIVLLQELQRIPARTGGRWLRFNEMQKGIL